ncbi:MAG: nucleotidyltransferase domain-containing protein [Alphaproteobacteria bacterium]|jgi:predicted nucleotidyltransferase
MNADFSLAREYKRRVDGAFNGRVAKVVLYGSRARGDARQDSDWDIAIFLTGEPSSDDLNRLADLGTDLLYETGQFIQPLPLAGRRLEEDSYLLRAIRTEGIPL